MHEKKKSILRQAQDIIMLYSLYVKTPSFDHQAFTFLGKGDG